MGKPSKDNSMQAAMMAQQQANTQGAWNSATAQQQQIMNMTDQVTPWGNLNYQQIGTQTIIGPNGPIEVPRYQATQNLSPSQQAIFDSQQQAQSNLAGIAADQTSFLGNYLKDRFSLSGAPGAADISQIGAPQYSQFEGSPELQTGFDGGGDITRSYGTDYAANVQEVQDALMQRMDPYMQQDESRLRQQLINSGLRPGTAAYSAEMERLSRQQNDARLGAVIQAGQEQSRLAGLARDQAQFQNTAQQQAYDQALGQASFGNAAQQQMYQNNFNANQANNSLATQGLNDQLTLAGAQNAQRQNWINEQLMVRNQPLNEINALLSGTQVQQPNATYAQTPQTQVAGVDYLGAFNNALTGLNQQDAARMGGMFGLGAAGLGALGSIFRYK